MVRIRAQIVIERRGRVVDALLSPMTAPHLWTPPSAQADFLRFWSLVGCCHLSGL
jgi:hypothetical protein